MPQAGDEVASAQRVLQLLDKVARTIRTYGFASSMTARFLDQLHADLSAHLETFGMLGVVVDRAELSIGDAVVYRPEVDGGEGLAFRLYVDGIRELRLLPGLTPAELRAFVEALCGLDDSADADDDIVTRLWANDLATIAFVTAEDIVKAPSFTAELSPQQSGFFSPPPSSFAGLLDRERRALATAPASSTTSDGIPAAGENLERGRGSMLGFEVSPAERESLARELATEAENDATGYVLAMVRTILVSEQSPELLSRALALLPSVLDDLLRTGRFQGVLGLAALLEDAPTRNLAFDNLTHKALAERVLASLNVAERLALLETGLNAAPDRNPAGLAGLLERLEPSTVGTLCAVLAKVESPEHRAVILEALARLALRNPEPLFQAMGDPRPGFVIELISLVSAWKEPGAAERLSSLTRHPDATVRREAVAAIAELRPRGDGSALAAFASDPDRGVKLHALRILGGGLYEVPWEAWKPHLDLEAIVELPAIDKRNLFHALRATAGEATALALEPLLVDRGWKRRQKKEETALVAVDVLARLGTEPALRALQAGQKDGTSAVQKACAAALDAITRRAPAGEG